MDNSHVKAVFVFLFAFGAATAFAAPMACPDGAALSVYTVPGFSCTETINSVDFIFKSFTFQATPQPGSLSAAQIFVFPVESINVIGLNFTGNFVSQTSGLQTYQLNYIIDPPPPIIRGEQIDVDPATLQTILCPALNALPACPPGVPYVLTTSTTASVQFLTPANTLGVQNTFTLSGFASSGGFDNLTLLFPPPYPPSVPEPASIALTASGLLGLLAFRSRAKVRQVVLELRS